MKRLILTVALTSVLLPSHAALAGGSVERACLYADRPEATRNLCGCIQDVADAMLTRSERSKVAKFFKEPHKTQETRQSGRRTDEAFWQKYKEFGQTVSTYCSR